MKNKTKLVSLLSLFLFSGLTFNAVSCSGTSSVSYEDVTLRIRLSTSEVEVGSSIDLRVIVDTDSTETGCTFTCSDDSIASLTVGSENRSVSIKGLKEGKVTITITSKANPTVSKEQVIKVIATKPSLQQVIKNIQASDSYSFLYGYYDNDTANIIDSYSIRANNNSLVQLFGEEPYVMDETTNKKIAGITLDSNGQGVYVEQEKNGEYAPVVARTCDGLLDKNNFKGAKEDTLQPEEFGYVYGLEALNPNWFTSTKASDNTYVIEGGELNEDGVTSTDINAAYAECVLWKMIDSETYDDAVKQFGESYYISLAGEIDTEIKVTGVDTFQVLITYKDTDEVFGGYVEDVGETDVFLGASELESSFSGLTASKPTLVTDLTDIKEKINGNNYVQVNSIYPDHKTELTYNTYFTSDYVFYDCNAQFKALYDSTTGRDEGDEGWEKTPYGYVKGEDGIYKFDYNEDTNTVTKASTKEEGTDSKTTIAEYSNYISTFKSFTTDLIYSFSDDATSIWANGSNTFHSTRSFKVANEFMSYYAPEDIEDQQVEKMQAGVGLKRKDGVVDTIFFTVGYTPYTDSQTASSHTYGVDNFKLTSFGSANENNIDSLLK